MRVIFLTVLSCLVAVIASGQFIYKIKTDSLLITNDSCTAELNLENTTRNVLGFLYNKGNGRTEFRKAVIQINDSLFLIGSDTLKIPKGVGSLTATNGLTFLNDSLKWGGLLTDNETKIRNTYNESISQVLKTSSGAEQIADTVFIGVKAGNFEGAYLNGGILGNSFSGIETTVSTDTTHYVSLGIGTNNPHYYTITKQTTSDIYNYAYNPNGGGNGASYTESYTGSQNYSGFGVNTGMSTGDDQRYGSLYISPYASGSMYVEDRYGSSSFYLSDNYMGLSATKAFFDENNNSNDYGYTGIGLAPGGDYDSTDWMSFYIYRQSFNTDGMSIRYGFLGSEANSPGLFTLANAQHNNENPNNSVVLQLGLFDNLEQAIGSRSQIGMIGYDKSVNRYKGYVYDSSTDSIVARNFMMENDSGAVLSTNIYNSDGFINDQFRKVGIYGDLSSLQFEAKNNVEENRAAHIQLYNDNPGLVLEAVNDDNQSYGINIGSWNSSPMYVFDNRSSPSGLEYADNYHAYYTNRSLIDKEYVDALAISGVVATNGLTNTENGIGLGGALNNPTNIDLNSNSLQLYGQGTENYFGPYTTSFLNFDTEDDNNYSRIRSEYDGNPRMSFETQMRQSEGEGENQTYNSGSAYLSVGTSDPHQSQIGLSTWMNNGDSYASMAVTTEFSYPRIEFMVGRSLDYTRIVQDSLRMVLTLPHGSAEYADNYHSNYTSRSLVDKEYVDSVASLGSSGPALGNRTPGSSKFRGDGETQTFTVQHNHGKIPDQVLVTPNSQNGSGQFYVSEKTATTFSVTYVNPPWDDEGDSTVKLDWECIGGHMPTINTLSFTWSLQLNEGAYHINLGNSEGVTDSVEINWGDGSIEKINLEYGNGNLQHSYADSGTFHVLIKSLSSISYMDLTYDQITSLVIDSLPTVTSLNLFNNLLTNLAPGSLPQLTYLDVSNNQLSTIDINQFPGLQQLYAGNNYITTFTLSDHSNIQSISLGYNQIDSLSLDNLSNLNYLEVTGNQLTGMHLNNLSNLNQILAYYNQLSSIDISSLSAVQYLYAGINPLTSLILGNNTLFGLDVQQTQLSSYNFSGQTSLNYLNVSYNGLSSIDVSANTQLANLFAYNNSLSSLNLSAQSSINNVNAGGNHLTSVTFGGISNLQYLTLSSNQLSVTSVSNLLVQLDNAGRTYGYLQVNAQSPAAAPNTSGQTAKSNLITKHWNVTTD